MKIIKTEYEQVGSYIQLDKNTYRITCGYGENGAVYFKDGKNFERYPDAPCYLQEAVFENESIVINEYETYKTLLEKCNYNEQLCKAMFDNLNWQSPETWLNELDEEDLAYFYDFVKVGNKVFWNEQPWRTIPLGFYEVKEIKDKPENWTWDTSVILKVKDCNGEQWDVEAHLNELSQTNIKLKLNKYGKNN